MSYEKDGEKYYIVDAHATSGTPAARTGSRGARSTRRAGSTASTATTARPAGDPLGLREVPQGHARGLRAGHVRRGLRRQGRLPVDLPLRLVHRGLPHRRPQRWIKDLSRSTPTDSSSTAGSTRAKAMRVSSSSKRRQEVEPEGRQGLHRQWYNDSRGWRLDSPEAYRFLEKCQELGIKDIHAHKGPTLAAGQGRLQPRRHRRGGDPPPGPELYHRARIYPAHRGLLLHGGAGAQRVRGPVRASRPPHARRPKFFARSGSCSSGSGRAATFGSGYDIGTPKWQIEGFVDWQMPDDRRSPTSAATTATTKKILGLNAASSTTSRCPPVRGRHDRGRDRRPRSRARRRRRPVRCPA